MSLGILALLWGIQSVLIGMNLLWLQRRLMNQSKTILRLLDIQLTMMQRVFHVEHAPAKDFEPVVVE